MEMSKFAKIAATAAAIAFVTAPITSTLAQAHGHHGKAPCYGVNACKGKGACKTATSSCKGKNACKGKGMNSCKGKNACKGKGMMMMSKKACMKKGGTTEQPKS